MDDLFQRITAKKTEKRLCKGKQTDGSKCRNIRNTVIGYCEYYLGQAHWTRELVEKAVETNNGPKDLVLAGADLSGLDLRGLDLHEVIFFSVKNKSLVMGERPDIANLANADLSGANLSNARMQSVNLQNATLNFANLSNAFLVGANLDGVKIFSANFRDAQLHSAILKPVKSLTTTISLLGVPEPMDFLDHPKFQGAALVKADLARAYLRNADFSTANLHSANLEGATLEKASFQGAMLMDANLKNARLGDATFQNANLSYADLSGLKLHNIKQDGMFGTKLHAAILDGTLIKQKQLGRAIGDEQDKDYSTARESYLGLKKNFDGLGDYDAASWSYIKERQMERKCNSPFHARRYYGSDELGDTWREKRKLPVYHPKLIWFYGKHTAKWIGDLIVEIICGYGERPWRTLLSMILVYLGFFLFYWYSGSVTKVIPAGNGISHTEPARNLIDIARFTLGAFTTMGTNDLLPRADWIEIVMGVEALLGIGFTGLLGFVIGNRIRRS